MVQRLLFASEDSTPPAVDQYDCIVVDECHRGYLNNSQFLELARDGWIGCDSSGLAVISEVIAAGQKGGKIAMYAVIKGSGSESARTRRKRF